MFTLFTCFDIHVGTACIIMYCQDQIFQEVKGLKKKLYAYALDRKKTYSHANLKSSTATVIELRFFLKKKMKAKKTKNL